MNNLMTARLRDVARRAKHSFMVAKSKMIGLYDPMEGIVASSQKIHGWIAGAAAKEMARLAYGLPDNAVIVEIGVWMGRSTAIMAASRKLKGSGKVYSVDPFDCSGDDFSVKHYVNELSLIGSSSLEDIFRNNMRKMNLTPWVEVLKGTSDAFAPGWTKPIDLLLLDADQTEQGARSAFDLWSPFLKKGGHIILSNTTDTTPGHDGNQKVFTQQVVAPAFCNIRRVNFHGFAEKGA